jgi:hypothetical protein
MNKTLQLCFLILEFRVIHRHTYSGLVMVKVDRGFFFPIVVLEFALADFFIQI